MNKLTEKVMKFAVLFCSSRRLQLGSSEQTCNDVGFKSHSVCHSSHNIIAGCYCICIYAWAHTHALPVPYSCLSGSLPRVLLLAIIIVMVVIIRRTWDILEITGYDIPQHQSSHCCRKGRVEAVGHYDGSHCFQDIV